jgi:hypothetical protein
MGGVVEQARAGSIDAQLACFGHEDSYQPGQTEADTDESQVWLKVLCAAMC